MSDLKIALAETYDVIKHSDIEIQNKISQKFMNLLISCKDNSYISHIDYEKSLENQIQHETKVILGIIYRDYLCTPEKRQELINNEKELLEKIEKEKNEKYSVDNLFKNKKNIENKETEKQIVEYKKIKWYEKIVEFFKKIFSGK